MAMHRETLFVLRARLARRLGLIALVGLLLLFALALVAMSVAGLAAAAAWSAIVAGEPLWSAGCSLVGVLAALTAASLLSLLWTAPPPAQGVRLGREGAEPLHELLGQLGAALKLPSISRIYVTDQMNAQIHQSSRWGIGPLRASLMIGLPLAHSLSPTQFGAVIAHELAHLSAQRRGLAGAGCAVRAWSMRVLDRLSSDLGPLASWLDRLSYPFCLDLLRLARIEEYEADCIAASLVGPELVGEALIETSLKSAFLDRDFWPSVEAFNADCQQPGVLPFHFMANGLEASFMRTLAQHAVALEASFGERGSFHPSLAQRLQMLGVACRVPAVSEQSAASYYFAPLLSSLSRPLDQAWWHGWQNSQRRRLLVSED